jgi:hypothetical protein
MNRSVPELIHYTMFEKKYYHELLPSKLGNNTCKTASSDNPAIYVYLGVEEIPSGKGAVRDV